MRLLLVLLFVPVFSLAQQSVQNKEYTRNIYSLDLGLTGLQAGFELQTGHNQTALLRAGVAPVYYSTSFDYLTGQSQHEFSASINISAEYRVYYNFQKRADAEKKIRNNAANYFALSIGFLSEPLAKKYYFDNTGYLYAGPVWGFNRSLSKRIGFNFNLGPGYIIGLSNSAKGFTVLGDARFLLILN